MIKGERSVSEKNNINALATEYLVEVLNCSALIAVSSAANIINGEMEKDFYESGSAVSEITKTIVDCAAKLAGLGGEAAVPDETFAEAGQRIISIAREQNALLRTVEIAEDILGNFNRLGNDISIANLDENNEYAGNAGVTLANMCLHSFSHLDSQFEEKNRLKAGLLSAVPMRMTKTRYADYVISGASMLMKDESEKYCLDVANSLMLATAPFALKEYSKAAPSLKVRADGLLFRDFDSTNNEESETLLAEARDLEERLASNIDYLATLYECVQYYNIMSLLPHIREKASERYPYTGDFLKVFADNPEEFFDLHLEGLYNRLDKVIERPAQISSKIEELVAKNDSEKKSVPIGEDLKLYVAVKALFLTGINEICEPFEYFAPYPSESADSEFKAVVVKRLSEFLENAYAGVGSKLQKLIKQASFINLPCPMNDGDAVEYMVYSYEQIRMDNEKKYIFDKISEVLHEIEEFYHHHDHDIDGHKE